MEFTGKLSRWNDKKGFGFITPIKGGGDIFIHISAVKRSGRRPSIGDTITFNVHSDNNGKKRAVNAVVEGTPSRRITGKHPTTRKKKEKVSIGVKVVLFVILVIGVIAIYLQFGYNSHTAPENADGIHTSVPTRKVEVSSFSCQGKTYCSEMMSCAEAKYYIKHCPGTKMDGDRDGVPCESQLCGR